MPVITPTPSRRPRRRRPVRLALIALALVYLAVATWHVYKPMPAGTSVAMPLRSAGEVALFADYTWQDAEGHRQSEASIFDEILRLIGQAQRLIVIDMFLYNDFAGAETGSHRPLSAELTQALLARKSTGPDMDIVVITDPFNELYGGLRSIHLQSLRDAGIEVVISDLKRLRTPNPAWSGVWRLCCAWAGNRDDAGWLPNPVGPGEVTLRSYLSLLNFNANHRKTLVVDDGDDWTGLVSSGNPHDASSAHGNVALRFRGQAALDLLDTERAVIAFSAEDASLDSTLAQYGFGVTRAITENPTGPVADAGLSLQVLTEAKIRDALLAAVDNAQPGDDIAIDVFYFSHRGLIESVIAAHQRGVSLRVLLDPNEDAFGRKKNGVPNRQVALDLHGAGVPVRWCDTHGEQCHSKFLLKRAVDGPAELVLGSANFTRRNLDDYNLETSVRVVAPDHAQVIRQAGAYFEQRWTNANGRTFSVPYERFADDSRLRYWWYRFTEASGLSTY